MLDACQAFKAAFLHQCLQQGLSLEETHELVKEACARLAQPTAEKQAGPWPWLRANIPFLGSTADAVGGTVTGIASGAAKGIAEKIPGLAVGAYLGVPIAAGAGAGYGLAQLEGLNDEDPAEIKTQETIEAYQRAAARAALQKQLRQGREARRPSRPLL